MSTVERVAGGDSPIIATWSLLPASPRVGIYNDQARTVLAAPLIVPTATGNPRAFTFLPPTSLGAGTYFLQFTADGQPADADDTLVLLQPGVTVPTSPVSLQELRDQLGYDVDEQSEAGLQGALDAAVEVVEGECGPLTPRQFTEQTSPYSLEHLLSRYPVVSVTLGTLLPGGVVRLPSGTTSITYTYGRTAPTAAQRMAVLVAAQDLWETRRGQGFPSTDTGEYVVTPTIRRRVRELLGPTLLPPAVA